MPGIWHENYWFARHEAAYRWLLARLTLREADLTVPAGVTGSLSDRLGDRLSDLSGGRVLDAGCGEGYGAALLAASGTARVVGLDYDTTAIRHADRRYDDLACVQGNLVQTGFADGSFDLVVSLQTVEHLWDQRQFVAECRRILARTGTLVLSTPNRMTFPSGNWYHTNELTAKELVALVEPELEVVELHGLSHGPRLAEWEATYGSCVTAQLTGTPDTWSSELVELVRSIDHRDFTLTLHQADLDSALDLILIAQPRVSPLPPD